jgi:hypothetical protein
VINNPFYRSLYDFANTRNSPMVWPMSKGGRPKTKNKMSERLSTSVTEDDVEAFKGACRVIRVEPTFALRELAAALVTHVGAHKSVTFPIRLAD